MHEQFLKTLCFILIPSIMHAHAQESKQTALSKITRSHVGAFIIGGCLCSFITFLLTRKPKKQPKKRNLSHTDSLRRAQELSDYHSDICSKLQRKSRKLQQKLTEDADENPTVSSRGGGTDPSVFETPKKK